MAPKKCYSPHQMGLAMQAVGRGESCSSAAKKYGVPRMTLRNKVTGKSPASCSMGPSTILSSDEEALLIQWLFSMAERHCPVGKEQLLDSVQLIIKCDKRQNPFTHDRPGRKWYDLFLKRHPEISERVSQNLTTSREAVKEEQIKKWFSELEQYFEDSHLSEALKDPSRVFNTDESAFFLNPKQGRVLVKRGDKNIYSTSGNERENLTVLITANAAGQVAPPMVVFSYERIPKQIAESIPSNWGIGRSENGWMCGSTFFEYVTNIFYPWLIENNFELPIIFFLDGHASHLTKHLSDFCCDKQIEIIALYPNSTHLLQPMDVAVFRPLKLFWRQQTRKWKTENLGQQVKKENFAPILKCALEDITPDCVRNGFRAAGLFPFGPDLVDFTKLNVHNRSITTGDQSDSMQNKTFLCQLEQEIEKMFTQTKLDTFNKCFYLNASDLAAELPNEDLTMYTIWAKYKHLCQVINVERAIEAINNESNKDLENRQMQKDLDDKHIGEGSQSTIQNQEQLIVVPVYKTPSKIVPSTFMSSTAGEDNISITNKPSTSANFAQHMLNEKGVIVPSPFKKALFWPEPTSQKKRRSKKKIPSAITSKAWRDFHDKKEREKKGKEVAKEQRKQKLQEKRELKDIGKRNNNKNKAQKKPTGFTQNIKKRRRISVTSSDTADSDVTYAETGESDFENQSYDEDIPLTGITKSKNEERSATASTAQMETGSFVTNVNEVEMECDNQSNVNLKERDTKEKDFRSEPVETLSQKEAAKKIRNFQEDTHAQLSKDLEARKKQCQKSPGFCIESPKPKVVVEMLPQVESIAAIVSCVVSQQKLLQDHLTVDDYVLVSWNERSYPGQIISMSEEGLLVSCLKKGKSFWRWPVMKDIQLYRWDSVVCQIGIPKFIKKGCFTIPEIDS